MKTPITIDLGRVGGPARNDADLRGRVLYLPDAHLILIPQNLRVHGWDCVVVAGAPQDTHLGTCDVRLTVPAADLATGHGSVTVTPDTHPDMYTQLWLPHLWQRWRTGSTAPVGWLLVRHCRIPDTITITLANTTRTRVMIEANLTPHRPHERLGDLVTGGVLTEITPGRTQDAAYPLTFPELPAPEAPAMTESPVNPMPRPATRAAWTCLCDLRTALVEGHWHGR
jgi:hypothetical protein